jgi:hypothetical protein
MFAMKSLMLFGFLALAPSPGFGSHKFNAREVAMSTGALSWSSMDDNGVTTRANHCTAFKVNGQWLTAGHCVLDENGEMAVRDYQIGGGSVLAIRVDAALDVAKLIPDLLVIDNVPSLDLATHAPDFGDFVAVIGHPYGWPDWLAQIGTVSNPSVVFGGVPRMLMNVPGAPGDSGSSVVDEHGRVVGILVGGFCWSPFGDVGFCPESAAVTWAQVKTFLEAH